MNTGDLHPEICCMISWSKILLLVGCLKTARTSLKYQLFRDKNCAKTFNQGYDGRPSQESQYHRPWTCKCQNWAKYKPGKTIHLSMTEYLKSQNSPLVLLGRQNWFKKQFSCLFVIWTFKFSFWGVYVLYISSKTPRIHVWYIYIHMVDFHDKCR